METDVYIKEMNVAIGSMFDAALTMPKVCDLCPAALAVSVDTVVSFVRAHPWESRVLMALGASALKSFQIKLTPRTK